MDPTSEDMSAVENTILFGFFVVVGFAIGFEGIERWLADNSVHKNRPPDTGEMQVSVNAAILYATIALVLSSVVSEWPPEGQATLPVLEDIVFFGTSLIAALIVGRVTKLLWKLESNFGH